MKVITLMDYNDFKLKKYVLKGTDLVELYKESDIELDQERIDILVKGNDTNENKPFVEVIEETTKATKVNKDIETADVKKDNVETADIKPKRTNRKTNK